MIWLAPKLSRCLGFHLTHLHRPVVAMAGVALSLILCPGPAVGQDPNPTPTGSALRTIFSPSAAPQRKTMGLLQRSFLDVTQQSSEQIELALVIDGTDSMADEIEGVKQSIDAMREDLQRFSGGRVRVAVVVYRDSGSPSGPVTVPLDRFIDDPEAIAAALDACKPESGAPFFHEMADAGLHAALDQLPWSTDSSTTRWVFLFGDAPPYAENFSDPKVPGARRQFATDLLIALAARKGIQLHCFLCSSSEALQATYKIAVPETRQFMNALAEGTDGLMLDLSYPDIRKAIVDAGRKPRSEYARIDPITQQDLENARAAHGPRAPEESLQEVQIAVLPHLPLDQMSFDPRNPAVQVSTALRHKLEDVPRMRVISPYDVERQLRRLRAEGIEEPQKIRALAARLGADYVLWGETDPSGAEIRSAVFSRSTGESMAQVNHTGGSIRLASAILNAPTEDPLLRSLRNHPAFDDKRFTERLTDSLASSPATTREILAALEALEQSLGYLVGDPASNELLRTAATAAEAALKDEPRNGVAHWLLANTNFNLAQQAIGAGNQDEADSHMQTMVRSLERAYRFRDTIASASLSKEIASDYVLLADRDVSLAIKRYEAIASDRGVSSSVRRRAHWMLTGIYAGDWSVDAEHVDPSKAREHAIAILANWEKSPEAELLRTWLRWDPKSNKTESPYLPKSNARLAQFALNTPPTG